MIKQRLFILLGLWVLSSLSGCYYWRSADTPMASLLYCRAQGYQLTPAAHCQRALDAMIMLPGIGDGPEQFAQQGLVAQVRRADIPVDVMVADAHFGYYRERSVLARLQQDVIAPAKRAGYRHLHFSGVSLGGFGGLLYWRDGTPMAAASLLLLTPYLGEPEHYQYKLEPSLPAPDAKQESLWPWLDALPARQRRHWYLGLARQGKFYAPNQVLGKTLPSARVVEVNGKHNWQAWRQLWPPLLQALKRDFYASEHRADDTE
jgi:hypothetical protein